MSTMKGIGTVAVPDKWSVIYEVDFTSETPAAWSGDGAGNALTLNGIEWIAGNSAYAAAGSPDVSSDGAKFVITSAESSSRWYFTTQTGPIVFASLDAILSAAGHTYSQEDTIAIQTLTDFTIDTAGSYSSYFYSGLYVGDGNYGASSTAIWYHNCWLSTGADNDYGMTRYGGGTGQPYSATGLNPGYWYDSTLPALRASNPFSDPPSFYELVIYPATGWAASAGTNTTFPDPLTVSTFRSYGNMELKTPKAMGTSGDGSTINPGPNPQYTLRPGASGSYGSDINVGMWAAYLTNTTRDSAITCKFTKFRVLKRNK